MSGEVVVDGSKCRARFDVRSLIVCPPRHGKALRVAELLEEARRRAEANQE